MNFQFRPCFLKLDEIFLKYLTLGAISGLLRTNMILGHKKKLGHIKTLHVSLTSASRPLTLAINNNCTIDFL